MLGFPLFGPSDLLERFSPKSHVLFFLVHWLFLPYLAVPFLILQLYQDEEIVCAETQPFFCNLFQRWSQNQSSWRFSSGSKWKTCQPCWQSDTDWVLSGRFCSRLLLWWWWRALPPAGTTTRASESPAQPHSTSLYGTGVYCMLWMCRAHPDPFNPGYGVPRLKTITLRYSTRLIDCDWRELECYKLRAQLSWVI